MNEVAIDTFLPEIESPEEKLLRRLQSITHGYLNKDQVESINHAFHFGAEAHSGQYRKSGESLHLSPTVCCHYSCRNAYGYPGYNSCNSS